jgi:hypothetical protein
MTGAFRGRFSPRPWNDLNININTPLQTRQPSAKKLFCFNAVNQAMPLENFKDAACS